MKHPLLRPALAGLGLAVCAACLPAYAQLKKPPSIEGKWQFQTSVIPNKGCAISGEITFRKSKAGAYACTFRSEEVCGDPKDGNVSEVKQSCTATFKGLDLTILSKVDEIVRVPPGSVNYTYKADDFYVRPNGEGVMLGNFASINRAPVKFWRTEELIS